MHRIFRGGVAAAVLLLLGTAAPPVLAHAIVVESTPTLDAVVAPEFDVSIRFNSRIDHRRSRLTIIGPDGRAQAVPLAAENLPDHLAGHVTGLAPGAYRLRWQVLAIDGHITRGDIPFRVER